MSVAILVYQLPTARWLTDLVILQGWGMACSRMTSPPRQGVSMLDHMRWGQHFDPPITKAREKSPCSRSAMAFVIIQTFYTLSTPARSSRTSPTQLSHNTCLGIEATSVSFGSERQKGPKLIISGRRTQKFLHFDEKARARVPRSWRGKGVRGQALSDYHTLSHFLIAMSNILTPT